MRIISFSGKAQHGKDTCAKIAQEIAQDHGKALATWAFAHPLKATVYGEQNGELSFEDIWDTKAPEVREILQQRGTEEGRDIHGESLWTLQTEAYLKLFERHFPIDGVIFTDVRFPNEVEFIRAGGVEVSGILIRKFREYLQKNASHFLSMPDQEMIDLTDEDFAELVEAEGNALAYAQTAMIEQRSAGEGIALYIKSDRNTLVGKAAKHLSETALDSLDLTKDFDGVINNNLSITLEDLRTQIEPYVKKLLNL